MEGAPTEAVGADGLGNKRRSSQRAGLARENCVRHTQLHVAETTSPGERPGVPQETVPQVWLAAPASPGLLARLLAAVLAGDPQGEGRGAGEEEEGRAGEAAGKGEVRQPPRRFVESSIGDLHCSFLQRNALRGTLGGFMRLRRLHNPSELGTPFVRFFFVIFKGSRDRHSHARRRC